MAEQRSVAEIAEGAESGGVGEGAFTSGAERRGGGGVAFQQQAFVERESGQVVRAPAAVQTPRGQGEGVVWG